MAGRRHRATDAVANYFQDWMLGCDKASHSTYYIKDFGKGTSFFCVSKDGTPQLLAVRFKRAREYSTVVSAGLSNSFRKLSENPYIMGKATFSTFMVGDFSDLKMIDSTNQSLLLETDSQRFLLEKATGCSFEDYLACRDNSSNNQYMVARKAGVKHTDSTVKEARRSFLNGQTEGMFVSDCGAVFVRANGVVDEESISEEELELATRRPHPIEYDIPFTVYSSGGKRGYTWFDQGYSSNTQDKIKSIISNLNDWPKEWGEFSPQEIKDIEAKITKYFEDMDKHIKAKRRLETGSDINGVLNNLSVPYFRGEVRRDKVTDKLFVKVYPCPALKSLRGGWYELKGPDQITSSPISCTHKFLRNLKRAPRAVQRTVNGLDEDRYFRYYPTSVHKHPEIKEGERVMLTGLPASKNDLTVEVDGEYRVFWKDLKY